MKKITIRYSDEYVNELVEREIKRRRNLVLFTILDFVCKVCTGVCVMLILGATGACENNAIGILEYILWVIGLMLLIPVGVYIHAHLKYKIIKMKRRVY